MIYPWQTSQWQQLITCQHNNRLPHALLMIGQPGLGKKHFACALAEHLLCEFQRSCGQCHSCHLIKAHNHPDLMMVEPESAGQMIKIDVIRELLAFVSETPLKNQYRIIILQPASAMNHNAANALLKTLEEPAPHTLLILINDQSLRLPATILSRCQKMIFPIPSHEVGMQWLQKELPQHDALDLLLNLARGAPLKAKEMHENGWLTFRSAFYDHLSLLVQQKMDPLKIAKEYLESDIKILLDLLQSWLQDVLRLQLTRGEAKLINVDYKMNIMQLAELFSHEKMLNFFDHVKKTYQYFLASLNLNRQLVLEELFIALYRVKYVG